MCSMSDLMRSINPTFMYPLGFSASVLTLLELKTQ